MKNFLTVAVLLAGVFAAAQDAKPDLKKIRENERAISASLQEQKDAFKELYSQEKNAVDVVKGVPTMSAAEKRAAIRQLRANYAAKRAAIRAELKAGRDAKRAENKAELQDVRESVEEPAPPRND